jgi:uncharacterized protein (TIGR00288 family)
MVTSTTSDIAVYLDLDNITIGARDAGLTFDVNLILDAIKQRTNGRIVLRRAYYDNLRQDQKLVRELTAAGFSVQPAVSLNNHSKNLVDMQIIVDALDTVIDGRQFSTYVLVTGDRDFTPLINSLRKQGKKVIGVGVRHTTSPGLVSSCDDYIYYESLVPPPPLTEEQLERLLTEALREVLENSETSKVQASVLKERMIALSGGLFNHQHYVGGSFSKFLERFSHLIKVQQADTTTYISQRKTAPMRSDLYKIYRSALKKEKLRVVAAGARFPILHNIVSTLQSQNTLFWRLLMDEVFERVAGNGREISKNMVNAVLLVAREGRVIRTLKGSTLSTAPVLLALEGEQPFGEAVICCDVAYLRAIRALPEPFDLEQAALALYDNVNAAVYLERYVLPRLTGV